MNWREELSKTRDTIDFHTKYVCAEEWKDNKLDEYESKIMDLEEQIKTSSENFRIVACENDDRYFKIKELKKQIEDMKCCENCKNNTIYDFPFWTCNKGEDERLYCRNNEFIHWYKK